MKHNLFKRLAAFACIGLILNFSFPQEAVANALALNSSVSVPSGSSQREDSTSLQNESKSSSQSATSTSSQSESKPVPQSATSTSSQNESKSSSQSATSTSSQSESKPVPQSATSASLQSSSLSESVPSSSLPKAEEAIKDPVANTAPQLFLVNQPANLEVDKGSNVTFDLQDLTIDTGTGFVLETPPTKGTASITGTILTYAHTAADDALTDTFVVKATETDLTETELNFTVDIYEQINITSGPYSLNATEATLASLLLSTIAVEDNNQNRAITWVVKTPPTSGLAAISLNGLNVEYTSNAGFFASDSFILTASNGKNTADVQVNVAVSELITITAMPDSASVNTTDAEVIIDVLANDTTTLIGEAIEVKAITTPPLQGTATLEADGTIKYVPNIMQAGTFTIGYTIGYVNTLLTQTATGTVTVTVNKLNSLHVITPDNAEYTITEDALLTVGFTLEDLDAADIENDFSFEITSSNQAVFKDSDISAVSSSLVDANKTSHSFTWQPVLNANTLQHGAATITIKATDKTDNTVISKTFNVIVSPENNAPVITLEQASYTIDEDGEVTIAFSVSDPDIASFDGFVVNASSSDNTVLNSSTLVASAPEKVTDTTAKYTLKLKPEANQNSAGGITVTITAADEEPLLATAALTLIINPINDAHVITPDNTEYTITEDALLTVGFTLEDLDAADIENDFSFEITSSNQAVFKNSDISAVSSSLVDANKTSHSFTWQPVLNANTTQHGAATITIKATDKNDSSMVISKTFNVIVSPINNAPVIALEQVSYTIDEDGETTINFTVSDVDIPSWNSFVISASSSDDTVLNSSTLVASAPLRVNDTTAKYTLKLKPKANQNSAGITVTITAADEEPLFAIETFTLIINPINDAPKAVNDAYTINEDIATNFAVLSNDTDVDIATNADVLLIKSLKGTNIGTTIITDQGGTAIISADEKSIDYTPKQDYSGEDSFEYTIEDAAGEPSTAKVTIKILPLNDMPEFALLNATAVAYVGTEDTTLTINFEVSDVETADAALTVQAVAKVNGVIIQSAFVEPSNASFPKDRVLKIVPKANLFGTAEIELTLSDGVAKTTHTIKVTFDEINDAPFATDDNVPFTEDFSVEITIAQMLSNDGDIDITTNAGDSISFVEIIMGQGPFHGTLTPDNASNPTKFTYVPYLDSDKNDSFKYKITDSRAVEATATVRLNCTPVNDVPLLSAISDVTMDEDATETITLNYSDPETPNVANLIVSVGSSNPALVNMQGLTIDKTTQKLTIKPAADRYGACIITVTISDGVLSTSKTFNLIVSPMPDAPVAKPDDYTAKDASVLTIEPFKNDFDIDGDTFDINIMGTPANGSLTEISAGVYEYKAHLGFDGTEIIPYTIKDSTGLISASANITIVVTSQGIKPTISPVKNYIYYKDNTLENVLLRVMNVDASETYNLKIESSNQALIPNTNLNINGATNDENVTGLSQTLGMALAANAHGEADITVTITYQGNIDSIKFNVLVWGDNTAPTAMDDILIKQEKETSTIDVLANDTDAEDLAGLRVLRIVTPPAHGKATIINSGENSGKISYGGGSYYYGTDKFKYEIVDSGGLKSTAWVYVTINPINDPPVAQADTVIFPNTAIGVSQTIGILANDYDYDDSGEVPLSPTEKSTLKIKEISANPDPFSPANISADFKTMEFTPATAGWYEYTYVATSESMLTGSPVLSNSNVGSVWIGVEDASGNIPPRMRGGWTRTNEDAPETIVNISGMVYTRKATEAGGEVTFEFSQTSGTADLLDSVSFYQVAGQDRYEVKFKPKADMFGSVTYKIKAKQFGVYSNEVSYTIYIDSVNDVPVIEKVEYAGTNTIFATGETINRGQLVELDVTIKDPDHTSSELMLSALSSQNAYIPSDAIEFYKKPAYGGDTFPNVYTLKFRAIQAKSMTEYLTFKIEITLSVSDGQASDEHAFDVLVKPENRAPTAGNYSDEILEDTISTMTVIQPGSDPDNDFLQIICDGTNGTSAPLANLGGLSIQDKQIVFVPAADYFTYSEPVGGGVEINNGNIIISYCLFDGQAYSNVGIVSIRINSVNDAPKILDVNNPYQMNEDEANYQLTFTATDVDKFAIHFEVENLDTDMFESVTIVKAEGEKGFYKVTIEIVPKKDKNHPTIGDTSRIKLIATDRFPGATGTTEEIIEIEVRPVNDPVEPKAGVTSPIAFTIDEDVATTFDITDYFHDVDGDAISIISLTGNAHGTVKNIGNKVQFTPDKDFYTKNTGNDADYGVFSFVLTDGNNGDTTVWQAKIKILPINDAPNAPNFSVTTPEDTQILIKPFDNGVHDVDNTPDQLSLFSITSASNGTAVLNGREITYTPKPDWHGTDSFTYTVTDGLLQNTGTISVVVTPVADDPRIAFQNANAGWQNIPSEDTDENWWKFDEDTTGVFSLRMWTPETGVNCSLEYKSFEEQGTAPHTSVVPYDKITMSGSGENRTLTFKPLANKFGKFRLDFTLSAGGVTVQRTVFIEVLPVNDKPIIKGGANVSTDEDIPKTGFVTATDVETSAANLAFTVQQQPAKGTVTLVKAAGSPAKCDWTYTPKLNYNYYDNTLDETFIIRVTDDDAQSPLTDEATVTVKVNPVNDAPTAPLGVVANKAHYKGGELVVITFTAGTDLANETPRNELSYRIEYSINGTSWAPIDAAYKPASLPLDGEIMYALPATFIDGLNADTLYFRVRTVDTIATNIGATVMTSAYTQSPAVKVDAAKPTITHMGNVASTFTNQNVEITVKAQDLSAGASGVKQVTVDGGIPLTKLAGDLYKFTVSKNETYVFKAEDEVGNEETLNVIINYIDKLDPNTQVASSNEAGLDVGKTQGSATDKIKITLTPTDAAANADYAQSGVATKQYAISDSQNTPEIGDWQTYYAPLILGTKGVWYVHTRVVDNAGNIEVEKAGPYTINNSAPIAQSGITATVHEEFVSAGKSNSASIVLGGTDADGDSLTYSITTPPNATDFGFVKDTADPSGKTYIITHKGSSGLSSPILVKFKVNDGTANSAEETVTVSIIDVNDKPTMPVLTNVSLIKPYYKAGETVTINWDASTDEETAESDLVYEVQITENGTPLPVVTTPAGATSYSYITPSVNTSVGIKIRAKDDNATVNTVYNGLDEDDFSIIYGASAFTAAVGFTVDATKPTITHEGNNPSTFTNENVEITVKAQDLSAGASGVKQVTVDGGNPLIKLTGDLYKFTVSTNGTYVFKAEDKVGNEETLNVIINYIDKLDPNTQVASSNEAGLDVGKTQGSATDKIKIILTYTDAAANADYAHSGVATKQYAISNSQNTPATGDWQTYSAPLILGTKGVWYVHTRVVDNAGNIEVEKAGPYTINNSAPIAQSGITATVHEEFVSAGKSNSASIVLGGTDADSDSLTYSITTPPNAADFGFVKDTADPSGKTYIITHKGSSGLSSPLLVKFKVNDGTANSAEETVTVSIIDVNDKPTMPVLTKLHLIKPYYKAGETVTINWGASTDEETAESDLVYEVQITENGTPLPVVTTPAGATSYSYITPSVNTSVGIKIRAKDDNATVNTVYNGLDEDAVPSIIYGASAFTTAVGFIVDATLPHYTDSSTTNDTAYVVGVSPDTNHPIQLRLNLSDLGGSELIKAEYSIINSNLTPATYEHTQNVIGNSFNITSTLIEIDNYYVHLRLTDGVGNVNVQAVGPYVVINTAPVAKNINVEVDEGGTVSIQLEATDKNIGDFIASYDLETLPSREFSPWALPTSSINGLLSYTHDGSETLTDTFTYTARDSRGAISTAATVNIKINPVNDAPFFAPPPTSITMNENALHTENFAVNDVDDPKSSLIISVVSNNHEILPPEAIKTTYNHSTGGVALSLRPLKNKHSTLPFTLTITVTDPHGASAVEVITVTVNDVNEAPVAKDMYYYVELYKPQTVKLSATDDDTAEADLEYYLESESLTDGTVDITGVLPQQIIGGAFKYTRTQTTDPLEDFVEISVSDGAGNSTSFKVFFLENLQSTEDEKEEDKLFIVSDFKDIIFTNVVIKSSDENKLKSSECAVVLTMLSDGEFAISYEPELDAFGEVTLTVELYNDANARIDYKEIKLMLLATNDAPTLKKASFSAKESEGKISATLKGQDDRDGIHAATSFEFEREWSRPLANGILTLNEVTGEFVYTLDASKLTAIGDAGIDDSFYVWLTEKNNNGAKNRAPQVLQAGVIEVDTDSNLAVLCKVDLKIVKTEKPISSISQSSSISKSSTSLQSGTISKSSSILQSGTSSQSSSSVPKSSASKAKSQKPKSKTSSKPKSKTSSKPKSKAASSTSVIGGATGPAPIAGTGPNNNPAQPPVANNKKTYDESTSSYSSSLKNNKKDETDAPSKNKEATGKTGKKNSPTTGDAAKELAVVAANKTPAANIIALKILVGILGAGLLLWFIILLWLSKIVVYFRWKNENGEEKTVKFTKWFARIKRKDEYSFNITDDDAKENLGISNISIHFSKFRFRKISEEKLAILFDEKQVVKEMPNKKDYAKKEGIGFKGFEFD